MAAESKTPREVATEVLKSVGEEIAAYERGLVAMRSAEVGVLKKSVFGLPQEADSNKQIAAKVHKAPKNIFDILGKSEFLGKDEDYIDARHDADPKKRYVHVGQNDNAPKDSKVVPAPGSGSKPGQSLAKDAMPEAKPAGQAKPAKAPTLKPAGVPGMKAGEAPKPPVAPGAPGMKKKEIGVFAKLKANKHTAATPGSHDLAATQVMHQKVVNSPIVKDSMMMGGDTSMMAMSETAKKSESRSVFEILSKSAVPRRKTMADEACPYCCQALSVCGC